MPETNIYDYEFTVNESEPKRAEMLNRLKDRVQHVDKKEIISSDEFVDGESNFDEDKALSAFLLYKLFPTKVNLLREHYTKGEVDGLLNDLIAKYYLKDQIDSMLNNLKNELKTSLDTTGDGLKQLANSLKSDLSKHRTLEELDHPDASVTTRKIRDHAITKDKLSSDLLLNIDAKANKAGDTFTGLVTFNEGLKIPSLDLLNTNTFHSISSSLNNRGESDLDVGTYDTTHQVNLCSTNNPGWLDANRNFQRFLVQNDLDDINDKINAINTKLNSSSSNGSMYKIELEYVEDTKMRIEYVGYNYGTYMCNLYLCKVPKNFTGIYYHTMSEHNYQTGGHDSEHTETSYQINTNIVLKNELANENNADLFYYDRNGRISNRHNYETWTNIYERSMFIKNGYICMRYGFRNRPEVERNLVDVGRNFNLGIYIIS